MDTAIPDFAFVEAKELRIVLEDYRDQTQRALVGKCHLGTIVGWGSLVEGLLTWALLRREKEALASNKASKDKQGGVRPLREWSLTNLIDVCGELGLIGRTARQASSALKDFRNFIHPYNVLKQSARPDPALAMSAVAAVIEIRRSVQLHM